MTDIKQVEQEMNDAHSVQIFTTDLNGRSVTLQVNPGNIESFFRKGVGFDGSSIAGYGTVDNSDKLLIPLMETFKRVEFANENLGFIIGRIDEEYGNRSELDPRSLLERVIQDAKTEFDLSFEVAPEHEFFLLTSDEYGKDLHTDKAGYFKADPLDKGELVRKKIVSTLKSCGIEFEKAHHEVTPSQHEINLSHKDPLTAADRTLMFSYIAKRVATEENLHVTFMPKPFNGYNRSALHLHISALDQEGNHAFYNPNNKANLSQTARQFIAGIVKYARETSIVMASTFNSYKAYVVGREAPIARGWGIGNRSSMIRIPYAEGAKDTRIELRSPDPAGNIYLQLATLIGMGLQGIREGLDCGEPDVGNTYQTEKATCLMDPAFLPRCFFEALVEAENSLFLKDFFGTKLYTQYMNLKLEEWESYRTFVTPREHKNNLHI